MRCVITGGSGFIGSHVIEALTGAGHQVTNVDVRGASENDVGFERADIRDPEALVDIFRERGRDVVFHIAGVANAREALSDPVTAVAVNVGGTAAVLDAARRAEVGRVILASTVWYYNAVDRQGDAETAGAGDITYLDETRPVLPEAGGHVYTTSKIAAEFLCHDFHRMYGLDFTILRYGIPYGPRMWPGLALRSFVENAFNGKPIVIFGDGSAVRRFVYVGDLAEAHVKALSGRAVNRIYNLEGARDVTIRELAETVRGFIPEATISYIEEPTRRGELDLDQSIISNQKARNELDWAPTTELDEGVRAFVDWYQERYGD